jgi:hypothetical protein
LAQLPDHLVARAAVPDVGARLFSMRCATNEEEGLDRELL